MTDEGGDRPHRARRIDVRINAALAKRLRSRGWGPRVVPHLGYGGDGWIRVLARVVLSSPDSRDVDHEAERGWRRFVTVAAGGVEVTLRVGGEVHVVVSDQDGYVDLRLAAELEPGWATAVLSIGAGEPVETRLRIVGGETRLGLVSDIDDTVMVTMLPRPLVAFRNTFLAREGTRRAVPGMSELYREIVEANPDVFVVYLSTGAWNTALALTGFLERHGFPTGPLLLTDWGPTHESWFRSGRNHKRQQLERLFSDLPHLRWLLVGDDGQHDPTVYAETAQAHPDKVLGVAIRQLSLTEQVVGHGVPITGADLSGDPVSAPDGFGLRDGLRARGLLSRLP